MIRVQMLMMCLFAVALLCACSSSEEVTETEPPETTEEGSEEPEVMEESGEEPEEPAEDETEPAEGAGVPVKSAPKADEETRPGAPNPALLDPRQASGQAPDFFKVRFNTTKGDFVVDVHREWCPRGTDRFYNLVNIGFFSDVAFFRVLEGFVAQFGISGDPQISRVWDSARIPDDPVTQSNVRGSITFATAGPNTRTTQFFINFKDNSSLDGMGFSPFGQVVDGMEVVDSLHAEYGEGAPRGSGPSQAQIKSRGNSYLKDGFPKLDYIKSVKVIS